MPIDEKGIIHINDKKKKFQFNVKDICLIITTCISIITPIVALSEIKNHKLQYEIEKANYEVDIKKLELEKANYKNDVQRLELEKANYENMLKENSIQLKSSYIVCHINQVENLFDNLRDGSNVEILSNDITKMFYSTKKKKYLYTDSIKIRDKNLQTKYGDNDLYPEVTFLKIEVISNRIVRDVKINFRKIETENNIENGFKNFKHLMDKEYYKRGKDINVLVGDVEPNDIILIPVILEYSNAEPKIDYETSNIDKGYIVHDFNESIYKNIYVPKTIICYDDFYEKENSFNVRDVLEDSLITQYCFSEKG